LERLGLNKGCHDSIAQGAEGDVTSSPAVRVLLPKNSGLLFVTLVIVAVMMMNFTLEYFDVVSRFVSTGTNDHSAAVFRWRATGGLTNASKLELFIVGNSVGREAIDQDALAREIGLPCYNFACTSLQAKSLPKLQVPVGKEDFLAVVVNAGLIDDRTREDPHAPWNRRAWNLYVSWHREDLAQLLGERMRATLAGLVGRAVDPWRSGKLTWQFKYSEGPHIVALLDSAQWQSLEDALDEHFQKDDTDHAQPGIDALLSYGSNVSNLGVKVIFIVVPDQLPAHFESNFDNGVNRAAEILEKAGFLVVDGRSLQIPRDAFYDHGHMLASGREMFTTFLASELKKVLRAYGGPERESP